uniref:Fatty acyl-CoA reductase n=1 Tax=Tetrastichus brontispae TaxID=2033808 RepID=A0A650FKV1_9HYME|nr:FAR26 [Tetrastichus brontispae]
MSEISNITDGKYDRENIKSTPIQEFYKDQTIFITGGTGFIGKVLIEKLLRCCSGISRIYVLIRKKKDQELQQRLRNLLEDNVFNKLRIIVPDFQKKIIGIAGDVRLENLGLSEPDIASIKKDVTIIFHSAATVRFDESLKAAVATNLQSTVSMLALCKGMKNLKAFIYVSTAYAHCFNNPIIEEKIYNYATNYRELLVLVNSLTDEVVETITPALTKPWWNTYTCSKASAENFLADQSDSLPVAIFRPSTVTASAYEPMPGWVDNYNVSTGVIAGIASGVMRTIRCDGKKRIDLVPVDFTVNALIACAWDVDMQVTRRGKNILIYNFTSVSDVPVTTGMVCDLGLKYTIKYPFSVSMWYPSIRYTKYKLMNNICKVFFHFIPALFIDLLARSFGKKPG